MPIDNVQEPVSAHAPPLVLDITAPDIEININIEEENNSTLTGINAILIITLIFLTILYKINIWD